jgi:hypothetical protein
MTTTLTKAFCIAALGITLGIAPASALAEQPTAKPARAVPAKVQESVKQVLSEREDSREASFDAFELSKRAKEATSRIPLLPPAGAAGKLRRIQRNLEAASAHKAAAVAHQAAVEKYDDLDKQLRSLIPKLDARHATRLTETRNNLADARERHDLARWSHHAASHGHRSMGAKGAMTYSDRKYVKIHAEHALERAGRAVLLSHPQPGRIDPDYLPVRQPRR